MTQVNGIQGGIGSLFGAYFNNLIQSAVDKAVDKAVDEITTSYDVDVTSVSDDEAEFVPSESAEASEDTSSTSGFMSSISTMYQTLVLGFLSLIGLSTLAAQQAQGTEETSSADGTVPAQGAETTGAVSDGNDKYTMTEDEKAYLTLHPDFVKDLLAEERYQEQYGDSWAPSSRKAKRLEQIKSQITDAEVQAYLQLHPNVIKNAIVMDEVVDRFNGAI